MSHSRPESEVRGGKGISRNELHDCVINDERPDVKYHSQISNKEKLKYLCDVMRYPAEAFDLDLAFPIEDWSGSEDNALICAGLYLSDLRIQYYGAAMDNDPGTIGELWTRHAEAEFWAADFNRVINKRRNAVILADIRDLH